MHGYTVYGLGLRSEFPIPELLESDAGEHDIEVRRAPVPVPRQAGLASSAAFGDPSADADEAPLADDDSWAERRGGETLCVFAGVARYLVRAGTILVDPEPGADFAAVRHLLLGPVLAHVLWQRDIFALHASVVGLAGTYAAFVGVSGEGKSTIAAALEAAGHVLVCDDVAALVHRDTRIEVLPGFPRIRLHADSLRGIGDEPSAHPAVHEQIDKRSKRVGSFAQSAVPLDALYVLETGPTFRVDALAPGAAIIEVLKHTYYAYQFAPLYGFATHLEKAKAIAQRVPAFRLTRPKDLARLPELVGFLEARTRA